MLQNNMNDSNIRRHLVKLQNKSFIQAKQYTDLSDPHLIYFFQSTTKIRELIRSGAYQIDEQDFLINIVSKKKIFRVPIYILERLKQSNEDIQDRLKKSLCENIRKSTESLPRIPPVNKYTFPDCKQDRLKVYLSHSILKPSIKYR